MSLASKARDSFNNNPERDVEQFIVNLGTIPGITLSVNDCDFGNPEYCSCLNGSFTRCTIWPYTIKGNEPKKISGHFNYGVHCNTYHTFIDECNVEHRFQKGYYLHFSDWSDAENELPGKYGFEKDENGFHILYEDLLKNIKKINEAIFG